MVEVEVGVGVVVGVGVNMKKLKFKLDKTGTTATALTDSGRVFLQFSKTKEGIIQVEGRYDTSEKLRKNNYIVLYVEGCSPKVKQFPTYMKALGFAEKHEKKNVSSYSDDWVDCIIQGEFLQYYSRWYGGGKRK